MTEWIGGRRPVAEALAAGRPAHRLLVSSTAKPNPALNALLAGARQASLSVETVSPDRLSRIAGFDGHQGVLLEVGERRWSDLTEMVGRAAPLTAAAVKASAGASEHLLLARVESLGASLHELKELGLRLVAADQEAQASAWEADLTGPMAIVVGSEGSGLSGAAKRRCDLLVQFPMAGRVASLNAATAGALLLFEVVRQRSAGGAR